MKSSEFITEDDNVVKGDFGKRGGPKTQTQNAEKISMAKAFGSEGYNVLHDAGIKMAEKPSYWSSLERKRIGEVGLQKVKKLFQQAGVELPEYEAWEVYPVVPMDMADDPDAAGDYDPEDFYVAGPLASIEQMPHKGVFVIRELPYTDDWNRRTKKGENIKTGDFLVDTQGASSYIRFWRMI